MYLFPLCINKETTEFIENKLSEFRGQDVNVGEIVTEVFMQQQNYKDALSYFISEKTVSEETFCKVGLNRKSKDYDRAYLPLYNAIKKVYFENEKTSKTIINLYETSDIANVKTHWREYLFQTSSSTAIKKSPIEQLQHTNMFSNLEDEETFKTVFFKTMHLIKIERTLEDYYDLNRRYLKISDTLLFADENVKFDAIPKYYFSLIPDNFYNLAFEESDKLSEVQTLEEISPYLKLDEEKLLKAINKDNKTSFTKIGEIKKFVADERTTRFNKLIDEKFSDKQIIYILQLIQKRADKEIQELVTDDADIPTIFEYILGIAWYKISERKGDILSFMNLSLEADLLPKTHAGGGEADLVFQYEAENGYPKHSLLIEATLADSTNQRRMEMEPVSRHLGEYLINHKGLEAYCLFITNFLHINVISDFRVRRSSDYYYYAGKNNNEVVNGMMITPLENELLITILNNDMKYPQLYKLFHDIQESSLAPKEWYTELKNRIQK